MDRSPRFGVTGVTVAAGIEVLTDRSGEQCAGVTVMTTDAIIVSFRTDQGVVMTVRGTTGGAEGRHQGRMIRHSNMDVIPGIDRI